MSAVYLLLLSRLVITVRVSGNIVPRRLFLIVSMWSDKYIGRPVCHTGHAYSSTGIIALPFTLQQICQGASIGKWQKTCFLALVTIMSTWTFQLKVSG